MIRKAVDLFCGAGGTSAGYLAACRALGVRADLLAINHWPTAIATHELNHRGVRHICETLEKISPREVIPSRHLHMLAASPECTHHSNAAGGRPRNEQSRATAWHVCRWVNDIHVDSFMIENVREFMNWGPLRKDGKPMKRYRGKTFTAFLQSLASLGYVIDHRILNAANYGDPTTRERLIILGRRGNRSITWPANSHAPGGVDGLKPWRAAREIIDWDLKGESIFGRKKPLCENTVRRIAAGLRKFSGVNAEPFLVMLYGTNDARSLNRPAPTVTSGGNHIALAEPFLVNYHGSHKGRADGDGRVESISDPVPTLDTSNRLGLVQPFVVHTNHGEGVMRRCHSVDAPLRTVTGANEMAIVEPFMMKIDQTGSGVSAVRSIDSPAYTVITEQNAALVQPFIVKYYKTGRAVSIDDPLDTITTKDRFMLVEPKTGAPVAEIDILFRMLQPHELAGAQGFPSDYQFTGNREDRVKQIGNAVPVNLATALCKTLLS